MSGTQFNRSEVMDLYSFFRGAFKDEISLDESQEKLPPKEVEKNKKVIMEECKQQLDLIRVNFTSAKQNWEKLPTLLKKQYEKFKELSSGQKVYFWKLEERAVDLLERDMAKLLEIKATKGWMPAIWINTIFYIVAKIPAERLDNFVWANKREANSCILVGNDYSKVTINAASYTICRFLAIVRCGFPEYKFDGSHLCGQKNCVNMWHILPEPPEDNLKRIKCHKNGVCSCRLEVDCLFPSSKYNAN